MNQLDEQTRAWWTEKGFVITMATVLIAASAMSPSTSVAVGIDRKDAVITEKAGERYSQVKEQPTKLSDYKGKKELTDDELIGLLKEVGFEGKSLKTAWAVVMKESRGRPLAHNGNRSTGDNSYGLFQINMIDELGEARRDKFELDSNGELFDPVTNAKIAYYMTGGGKDWSSWKVDLTQDGGGNHVFADWLTKYPDN